MQTWVTKQVRCMSKLHLMDILKKFNYVCLRTVPDNHLYSVNCKILILSPHLKDCNLSKPTKIISFYPCSFQEYITRKVSDFNLTRS